VDGADREQDKIGGEKDQGKSGFHGDILQQNRSSYSVLRTAQLSGK
jgi:hypothetical protein